jgi:hypothetical protein
MYRRLINPLKQKKRERARKDRRRVEAKKKNTGEK